MAGELIIPGVGPMGQAVINGGGVRNKYLVAAEIVVQDTLDDDGRKEVLKRNGVVRSASFGEQTFNDTRAMLTNSVLQEKNDPGLPPRYIVTDMYVSFVLKLDD